MPSYHVQVAELPSVPLAVVRRQVSRSDLSAAVREGCGRAWTFARNRKLPAGHNVAVYWDGSILLESGVELSADFAEEEGIVHSATPAGVTAFVTHIGPYEKMGAAHAAIREWCASQGLRLAGANWEVYGHWQEEWNTDSSKIRTDVYYQVAPGSGTGADAVEK